MRAGLILGFAFLAIPALAGVLDIDGVAGVYKTRHVIEITGEAKDHAQVEDVLEIVKTAPGEAYVNAVLQFTNGHECNVSSIMKVEGDALAWRHRDLDGNRCELRLSFRDGKVVFSDKDDICREEACGERGSLDGFTFDQKSRRPIRYMPRLLASQEYAQALKERGK